MRIILDVETSADFWRAAKTAHRECFSRTPQMVGPDMAVGWFLNSEPLSNEVASGFVRKTKSGLSVKVRATKQ